MTQRRTLGENVQNVVENETSTEGGEDSVASESAEGDPAISSEATTPSEVREGSEQSTSEATSADTDVPDSGASLLSDESLEKAYDNSIKAFSEGQIVKGGVVEFNRDEVMIDIGFKSEGIYSVFRIRGDRRGIASSASRRRRLMSTLSAGKMLTDNLCSRKSLRIRLVIWDEIAAACDQGQTVEGKGHRANQRRTTC